MQRIRRRPVLLADRTARAWRASVKSLVVAVAVVIGAALSGAAPAGASTPIWRLQFAPKPDGTSTFLSAVSCPLRGNCTAAGFATNSHGNPSTLAEHWDGSRWAIQPTPNPTGPPGEQQASFSGVSCTSTASCTAVGFYVITGGQNLPLAERWDGSSWTAQNVPLPGLAGDGEFSGVSCPGALDCIAVGETGGQTNVLAERWNGTQWTAQKTPRPAGANMGLASVSCRAREICIAVGGETTGTTTGALVMRASGPGPTWTVQADAAPAGTTLAGVSCPFSRSCTAVGTNVPAGTPPVPTTSVAEHWNGTSWALQTVPEPAGTFGAGLSGVWCLGSLNCTAVGDYGRGGPLAIPLAVHYR